MSQYSFRKFQPLSLRLWHWLNALVILGLLATVLIRKTFLSWRTNSALIEEKLKVAGTAITPELAKEIAVSIRNPLWDWHIYLGFALAVFFLCRIVIAVFVEKQIPGQVGIKTVLGFKAIPTSLRSSAGHFAIVKLGYAAFYLVTAVMIISGLVLNFKTELAVAKDQVGRIKEVHELLMWFFVVFVGGHLAGLVASEVNGERGLISDMVNGGEEKK